MISATALPRECDTALKEWATVLEACANGEQVVLIRKGGLIEPGSGFELQASAFVLYPTFEHQAVNYLRAPYQRYFEDASSRRAPEGQVRIEFAAVAVSSTQSRDPGIIDRLRAFHIYNELFVSQRLKWQPDQPVVIVPLRVWRLAEPILLPVAPDYAGCRSWVSLQSSLRLDKASPVLDDGTFHHRFKELSALLASP